MVRTGRGGWSCPQSPWDPVPNVTKALALPKPGLAQPHLANPSSAPAPANSISVRPCPGQTSAKPLWGEEPPAPGPPCVPLYPTPAPGSPHVSPYPPSPWVTPCPSMSPLPLGHPVLPPPSPKPMLGGEALQPGMQGWGGGPYVSPVPVDGGDDEGDGGQPQGCSGPAAQGQRPAGEGAQQGQ